MAVSHSCAKLFALAMLLALSPCHAGSNGEERYWGPPLFVGPSAFAGRSAYVPDTRHSREGFLSPLSAGGRLTLPPIAGAAPSHAKSKPRPGFQMSSVGSGFRDPQGDSGLPGSRESGVSVLPDQGFRQYIEDAPKRLLEHLQQGKLDHDGTMLTKKYIQTLEQLHNLPEKGDFFSNAVNGTWDLVYSSSRIGVPNPILRVRGIQAIYDGAAQSFKNVVSWEFEEGYGVSSSMIHGSETSAEEEEEEAGEADEFVMTGVPWGQVRKVRPQVFTTKGTFETICKYNVSSVPSRIVASLEEMRITPTPIERPPKDAQALVAALQRSIPREFFDPNGAVMDTTYLDPNLRIVSYQGKNYAGIRHVFARRWVPDGSTIMFV